MDWNVILPLGSSLLSFVFAAFLLDQWLERRRSYQLVWAFGMLWYGLSAGTEFLGGAFGWSEPVYRAWYLIGAIYVASWLGLGTVLLLGRTRFGYAFALSLLLAALFTFLSWRRYDYPDSGMSPYLYTAIGAVAAVAIVVQTYRQQAWPRIATLLVVGGSVLAVPLVLLAPLAAPGWAVDPATGIPTGELFPGYVRLLSPFFNITGAFALIFGALYSTYVFMPKVRIVRYSLQRGQPLGRFMANAVKGVVGVPVNFVASVPGTVAALLKGELNSRVPATILIAIGAFIPSLTSGLSRFGETTGFFLGELLGVVFLFAGFLVSIEVFREIRIPFTRKVLHTRRVEL